ncbi:hypothetical protein DDB_G0270476 [Dictyostelium discoideum AX4]|uniref:Uncharacterized protein n=1 Tax=Dictyostelium discoideum TaxID=44689 RepID=Q55EB5_DICDI|nr:hypothetical protein DDB_G0270476 [Dictyostelium discoideum AX4]EAL72588.1 hypothetical protein DDB_G0270476 [Dictyostelium discoideum AX4]|eukprot:XP_645866.1 hypothetical protein DDB_G0270476 [Dictyostelium discoideum AX4]
MKNKYIIVLYLFLLISQIYCVPPKCITTKNVYTKSQVFIDKDGVKIEKNVEWWVLEQLSHSRGAIYTDNELNRVINELAYYNIRNPHEPNPIASTYKQSYPNSSGKTIYNSLTYNDQPVEIIVTLYHPLYNYGTGTLDNQHAQHSICITLSKEELHIIPKYIINGNLNIQTINTVFPGSGAKRVSSASFYSEDLKKKVDEKKTGVIKLEVIEKIEPKRCLVDNSDLILMEYYNGKKLNSNLFNNCDNTCDNNDKNQIIKIFKNKKFFNCKYLAFEISKRGDLLLLDVTLSFLLFRYGNSGDTSGISGDVIDLLSNILNYSTSQCGHLKISNYFKNLNITMVNVLLNNMNLLISIVINSLDSGQINVVDSFSLNIQLIHLIIQSLKK